MLIWERKISNDSKRIQLSLRFKDRSMKDDLKTIAKLRNAKLRNIMAGYCKSPLT